MQIKYLIQTKTLSLRTIDFSKMFLLFCYYKAHNYAAFSLVLNMLDSV
jgi:hypothetical protein